MSEGSICVGHLLLCAVYVEVTAAARRQLPVCCTACVTELPSAKPDVLTAPIS